MNFSLPHTQETPPDHLSRDPKGRAKWLRVYGEAFIRHSSLLRCSAVIETSNIFGIRRLYQPQPANVSCSLVKRPQRVKSRHCARLRNPALPPVTWTKRSVLSTDQTGQGADGRHARGPHTARRPEMGLATHCSRKTRPAAAWLLTRRAVVLDGPGTATSLLPDGQEAQLVAAQPDLHALRISLSRK